MSNGNVERCATLLITRSESEYHGDVLLFSPFLTRIFVSSERNGRFFGRWWISRVESFVKGEEISAVVATIRPWAVQLIPTSAALILLPSRASYSHLFGTLSAWLLQHEVFDVSTSIAHCAGFTAVVTQRVHAASAWNRPIAPTATPLIESPFETYFRFDLSPFQSIRNTRIYKNRIRMNIFFFFFSNKVTSLTKENTGKWRFVRGVDSSLLERSKRSLVCASPLF